MAERRFEDVIASELAHALRRDGRLDEAEYRLTICIGNRIRDILNAGASVVRDNGDRLISCLVLATEERA